MVNKLRLGAVAVSTAAGIYFYNQSPKTDHAAAPAPVVESAVEQPAAPDFGGAEPAAPSPVIPLPAPSIAAPQSSPPANDFERAEPSPQARSLAGTQHERPDRALSMPTTELGVSEIPSAAPRLPGGKGMVRIYYGTNRKARKSVLASSDPADYYTADQGQLEFGVVDVSIPENHVRGNLETRRWYLFEKDNAAKHFVLQRIVPTQESVFLRELNREIAADPQREAFIFVHGFGTTFEAAAWRTGQLKADLDFAGPAVMYSWPSQGSVNPIAYFQDRDSVRESRDELLQFLEIVGTQTGAEKIHVIAHSMGNYLLAPTLAKLQDRTYSQKPLFDQLVLAAPDISAEMFLDEIAPKLDRTARRTTIYAADNDYALRASQLFNREKRLGTLLGIREAPAIPFIEVVDTAGAEFRLFEVGHSDYGGPVLEDLRSTIRGLNPTERGLSKHHIIPVHWEVPNNEPTTSIRSNIVHVNHSEVIPGTIKVQPVSSPSLWTRITSWWPW